jgi:uncharacterized protein (TIGR03437 family)
MRLRRSRRANADTTRRGQRECEWKTAYIYFFCSAVTSPVCIKDQLNVLTPLDNALGSIAIVVTNGSSATFYGKHEKRSPRPCCCLRGGDMWWRRTQTTLYWPPPVCTRDRPTPAKPGEPVAIYAVGLGLPSAPLKGGSASQSGSLPVLPSCQIGGDPAAVSFAALISPGLYQLNLTVPLGATDGDNTIGCTYRGSATPRPFDHGCSGRIIPGCCHGPNRSSGAMHR